MFRRKTSLDLIKNRQKLIKLADSSEAGWRVVDGYVSNPLAEDSDDEKKIYKAQTRAESKLKKEKTKRRTDQRFTPYEHKKSTPTRNPIPVSINNPIRSGRCFNYNEKGHWRRECLKQTVEHRNKISICTFRSTSIESSTPTSISQVSNSNTHTTIDSKLTQAYKNSTGVGRSGKVNRWKQIGANSYIVDVIENGYKIPFLHIPDEIALENNKSARDNTDFVNDEIERLLQKGYISRVTQNTFVVNPLTVVNNSREKLRLELDARHINPHLYKFKHKYEDATTARQLFNREDFIFSCDLKSAYYHLKICHADRTYLGFQWENQYYVYNVLPFGLATSGYIFSKVMRTIIKYWRDHHVLR
jgi:hypothetical protein